MFNFIHKYGIILEKWCGNITPAPMASNLYVHQSCHRAVAQQKRSPSKSYTVDNSILRGTSSIFECRFGHGHLYPQMTQSLPHCALATLRIPEQCSGEQHRTIILSTSVLSRWPTSTPWVLIITVISTEYSFCEVETGNKPKLHVDLWCSFTSQHSTRKRSKNTGFIFYSSAAKVSG